MFSFMPQRWKNLARYIIKKEKLKLNTTKFGTVRCFDTRTGKGWITPDDGGSDVIVRQTAINHAGLGQIAIGQTIGFDIARKSRAAVNLWATWSNR